MGTKEEGSAWDCLPKKAATIHTYSSLGAASSLLGKEM
jgi:hypothetical protein